MNVHELSLSYGSVIYCTLGLHYTSVSTKTTWNGVMVEYIVTNHINKCTEEAYWTDSQ